MPDIERVANCRSCNAEVVFRRNPKTGKAPPYDYPPQTCADCNGHGTHTATARVTGAVAESGWIDEPCRKCFGEGKVWISHFATCPAAAKWKGKSRER